MPSRYCHGIVDLRDRTMFEFASGLALNVDIRDFFELECAFGRQRKTGAAPEIEHVTRFSKFLHDALNLRLKCEYLAHMPWHFDEPQAPAACSRASPSTPRLRPAASAASAAN